MITTKSLVFLTSPCPGVGLFSNPTCPWQRLQLRGCLLMGRWLLLG